LVPVPIKEGSSERQSSLTPSTGTEDIDGNKKEGRVSQGERIQIRRAGENEIDKSATVEGGSTESFSQVRLSAREKERDMERQSGLASSKEIEETKCFSSQQGWDTERQSGLTPSRKSANPEEPNLVEQEGEEELWMDQISTEQSPPDHDWKAQIAKSLVGTLPRVFRSFVKRTGS
jgi:hypothetical protein